MELKDRSIKAQEKYADHLMTIATGTFSATFLGVLVVPLSAFIASLLGTSQATPPVSGVFLRMSWSDVFTFAILYFVPLAFAGYSRKLALGIYDRISKKPASKPGRVFLRNDRKRRFASFALVR